MENYTLYTHQTDLSFIPELLTRHLPKAKISEAELEDHQYQYHAKLRGGFFASAKTLTLNVQYRPQPDYQLKEVIDPYTQNLAGMIGFVRSIPATNPELRQLLETKIGSINAQIAFLAEPGLTEGMEALLRALAVELSAILFVQPGLSLSASSQPHFQDANLKLLLDATGSSVVEHLDVAVDAKYYNEPIEKAASSDQQNRKANSISQLKALSVPTLANLPVVRGESETALRTPEAITQRMYATLLCAAKATGLPQDQVDATIRARHLNDFSPVEQAFLENPAPDENTMNTFSWRYESVNLLAWALGLIEKLPPANTSVDTGNLVPLLMGKPPEEIGAMSQLRPVNVILDELDLVYRMHWACVNARVKGEKPPEALHPGIVYERYYALSWLVRAGDANWDDVSGELHT